MSILPGFAADPNLDVSLTLNTTLFLGNNNVRRVINTGATFYSGSASNDTTLQLAPATIDGITGLPVATSSVLDLESPTVACVIMTMRPVVVKVTVNGVVSSLPVTRLLTLDCPVTKLEFLNLDTQNRIQLRLTYLL